jgi:hypothetical protein
MASDKLNSTSAFWLDKSFFKGSGLNREDSSPSIMKNLKLLSYKRSISNFVKILTKRSDINVSFSSGQRSYTDGKNVVISSKINENNFDVTVGLALHEAAHILLTDFKILNLNTFINICADELGHLWLDCSDADQNRIHEFHNIVEDRYIDNYIYDEAPGYRGYYNSLYDYYFRLPKLTKWLKQSKCRTETFDNYKNQLLNIVNVGFDRNCLIGMPDIVKLLDLPNIKRLETTEQRLRLALQIYMIVMKNVKEAKDSNPSTPNPSNTSNEESTNETEESESAGSGGDESSEKDFGNESNDNSAKDLNLDNTPSLEEPLSAVDEEEIKDALKSIDQFLNGELNEESAASKKLDSTINALDIANASEHVSHVTLPNGTKIPVKCILVRHISEEVISAGLFPSIFDNYYLKSTKNDKKPREIDVAINNGLLLGKQLANRIMVRNEEKTLVINRLNKGKIFNRHIALLGADVENIFYKTKTDKFKKTTIHISIDASGSMTGAKFNNAIQMAVAIAKACTYLRDVNCIISFRSQETNFSPLMVIAYNSKKDHISKIPNLFPCLIPNSATPEGLCYDMYAKYIEEMDGNDVDRYVINLSDGEPAFHLRGTHYDYSGSVGVAHSREAWNNILKLGVTGLSYFIPSSYSRLEKGISLTEFGQIYGSTAKYIEANNLPQLANTINEMLVSSNAVNSVYSE